MPVRSDVVERVWVLCLDRKNKLIRAESVTSGTATGSLVHPRKFFARRFATEQRLLY